MNSVNELRLEIKEINHHFFITYSVRKKFVLILTVIKVIKILQFCRQNGKECGNGCKQSIVNITKTISDDRFFSKYLLMLC